MNLKERLVSLEGFDWDRGNRAKNRFKHGVEPAEAEEAFFSQPLVVQIDPGHSGGEERFQLLGRSVSGRRLFVSFTIRGKLVRVISARDQSRQERRIYEKVKADPEI
jgi:uncharacterized DUF497 family protein